MLISLDRQTDRRVHADRTNLQMEYLCRNNIFVHVAELARCRVTFVKLFVLMKENICSVPSLLKSTVYYSECLNLLFAECQSKIVPGSTQLFQRMQMDQWRRQRSGWSGLGRTTFQRVVGLIPRLHQHPRVAKYTMCSC